MKASLRWINERIAEFSLAHAEEEMKEGRSIEQLKIIGSKLKAYKEAKNYILTHETQEEPVTTIGIEELKRELAAASSLSHIRRM